jgi:putative peptidoglycan lipid II flippase
MGATVLNVVMIASVFLLAPRMGRELPEQIFALAIGVLVAGVAQAAFQLPSLRREGYRYEWISAWRDETVHEVVRKMIPGTIGVAAFQINVVIVQNLGLLIGTADQPVIAPFNYAVRLMELPQGVFGLSLATYLLPILAGLAAERNYNEFRATLRQGMGHLLLVNLLAAGLLIVLAEPIVRLLYERGQFGPDASARAAFALQWLAASLVGYSLVNILARAFFALGDTQTPMKVSVVCLVLNLILSIALVFAFPQGFQQGGFGLANTLTATLNCGLLLYALRRKLQRLELSPLRRTGLWLVWAGVLACLVALAVSRAWEHGIGHATLLPKIGAVFVPGSAAVLVYGSIALLAKIPAALEMRDLLLQKLR